MTGDLAPLIGRHRLRTRLHARTHYLVDNLVGQRAAALETERRGGRRVTCNRFAVGAGLARDPAVTVPRQPAAKHLFHVDHR
jgi:hypothetical protein